MQHGYRYVYRYRTDTDTIFLKQKQKRYVDTFYYFFTKINNKVIKISGSRSVCMDALWRLLQLLHSF
jgi:hypothetical protein